MKYPHAFTGYYYRAEHVPRLPEIPWLDGSIRRAMYNAWLAGRKHQRNLQETTP
jgi:hypothetical protein